MANYRDFAHKLRNELTPEQVITDEILCRALSVDASLYQLTPRVIVKAKSNDEVSIVLKACQEFRVPITFRAAGTSLSGQAVSNSALLILDQSWTNLKILEEGEAVRCQPGLIGAEVNRQLASYERKIGPDPASIDSCKIGGIAANNSSGMCCGTAQNSYQTMSDISLIFADGSRLDSSDLLSKQAFEKSHAELLEQLSTLAKKCKEDTKLVELIKHKYRLKNTTGFSINALVDFDDPIDILTHLMIGSEGCLGFISDITYRTVPDYQAKATTLVIFESIAEACSWVVENSELDIDAIELMDDRALASVPKQLVGLVTPAGHQVALLIECQAKDQDQLSDKSNAVQNKLDIEAVVGQVPFSTDYELRNKLWNIRKGIIPTIAGERRPNTSVIIEDIAFPVEKLADGIQQLQKIFQKHHYWDISIIGHARDGNLHFVMAQDFSKQEEITQYLGVMNDISDLIVEYGGSLKAEHGTGRNKAPHVEKEWGKSAYDLMKQIKKIIDPNKILNPGVVLNADPDVNVKNLKSIPDANPLIDQCMECGFCESVCPSNGLSLTPRQRISMYRHQQKLQDASDTPEHRQQLKTNKALFKSLGINTCATTGLCQVKCPVNINTGLLVLDQMEKQPSIINYLMKPMSYLHPLLVLSTKGFLNTRHWIANQKFIAEKGWIKNELPRAAKKVPLLGNESGQKTVYFSACPSRMFGQSDSATDQRGVGEVLLNLMNKANVEMITLDNEISQCCGLTYKSQGLESRGETYTLKLVDALVEASEQGKYPVVIDASPCTQQVLGYLPNNVRVYEACEYAEKYILPKLDITQKQEKIMLHVTCSSRKMEKGDSMIRLANECAEEVIMPNDIQCCGFAGSKGITHPQLNAHALSTLKSQVPKGCTSGYSNSRSCELGLTNHSGINYQSLLYLLDEVSETKRL